MTTTDFTCIVIPTCILLGILLLDTWYDYYNHLNTGRSRQSLPWVYLDMPRKKVPRYIKVLAWLSGTLVVASVLIQHVL